jgi:predicted Ser/Thr protein kinase
MCQTPPLASAEAPPSTPLPAGRSGSAPLAAEPAPPGALQVPGYDLLNQLGKGAMGVVYKARHRTLKRLVALKMIRSGVQAGDEEVARFRIEAEAVARLQHPNIVQIYEIGELDGQPFFSLELVEGGGLDRKLAGNPLPFREAAELLEVLARTVHFAHQQGIIHRDLKPQNVLLSKEGQPKVTDFGLAKQLDDDSNQTRSGSIMGTPSYVAPEQAAGRVKEVGPRADVYSLGAMFYEFLTGRPPFRGETVMDTLLLVLNEDPVPPSQLRPKVPRDLETICLKCLHKDPRKRYASAEDLADDLRRYLNREPILARPLGPYGRTWRWCRRNPLAASILLAVTLGGAFGLWFLSRLSGQLVRSTALESAAQQGDMLEGVNTYYSDRIAGPLTAQWVYAGHDYARFQRTEPAIPIPATLTIELGQFVSRESETGMQVRVYSDYPFRTRKDGGPRDDFERETLVRLRQNPKEPFYRFEQHEDKPVLRFAKARLMKESCIHCHLTHPDRNRSQPVWKAGDVRGVLEIIRPLEKDIEHTQAELRGSFLLIAGISAGLLVVSSLVLLVSNRRRRQRRA